MSTPTAEDRAEKRYPCEASPNFDGEISYGKSWREAYATCIREEVEPLEADNEKMLASGNRMCALLCLFYREAHMSLPYPARKDLVDMVNEWAEITGQQPEQR